MRIRWAVAVGTGWLYRVSRRLGIETRASQQAQLQAMRRLPDHLAPVAAGSGSDPLVRVVLLGNGPAESPGLRGGADAFPAHLAQALAVRTHRRVEVKTVLGGAFDLAALERSLQGERLQRHDALVVTAAYRPQLAEMPLRQWGTYVEGLSGDPRASRRS